MLNLIPPIPKEYIIKLLPDLVDQSKIIGELIELEASAKLTRARKRFFRLRLEGSPDLHLSYGVGLKDTYERSKAFNSALPQYTCKPVFIVEDGERHLFGQEFFEGTPIDEKYASNEISDEDVSKIISKIQKTFSSLEVESTHEAFLEEFNEFKETISLTIAYTYLTKIFSIIVFFHIWKIHYFQIFLSSLVTWRLSSQKYFNR